MNKSPDFDELMREIDLCGLVLGIAAIVGIGAFACLRIDALVTPAIVVMCITVVVGIASVMRLRTINGVIAMHRARLLAEREDMQEALAKAKACVNREWTRRRPDPKTVAVMRARIEEEFRIVASIGNKADIKSAMMNVDALLAYLENP